MNKRKNIWKKNKEEMSESETNERGKDESTKKYMKEEWENEY